MNENYAAFEQHKQHIFVHLIKKKNPQHFVVFQFITEISFFSHKLHSYLNEDHRLNDT